MKGSAAAIIAAVLSAASLPMPLHAQDLAEVAFLAGHWIEKKESLQTEEMWLPPRGGVTLGVNRTVLTGKKTAFEYMRIESRDGRPVYFASPAGKAAVEFKAIETSSTRLVFENAAHDFPQRVIYWREGPDVLMARIEGKVDGKVRSQEWRFARAK